MIFIINGRPFKLLDIYINVKSRVIHTVMKEWYLERKL